MNPLLNIKEGTYEYNISKSTHTIPFPLFILVWLALYAFQFSAINKPAYILPTVNFLNVSSTIKSVI